MLRSAVEALWAPRGCMSTNSGEPLRLLASRSLPRRSDVQHISLYDLRYVAGDPTGQHSSRLAAVGLTRYGLRRQTRGWTARRPAPAAASGSPLPARSRSLGGPCPHPAGERPCDGRWAVWHAA